MLIKLIELIELVELIELIESTRLSGIVKMVFALSQST